MNKTLESLKDIPEYYRNYLQLTETDNLLLELEKSRSISFEIFKEVKPAMQEFSYQPGKWTISEVLRHLIDCERIFAYRALTFSRLDNTYLPGFDENVYIENLKHVKLNFEEMIKEFSLIRDSTILLFKGMTKEMLKFKGNANNVVFTPELLGFIIAGHNIHHCNILSTRYLKNII